jgi:hypothetical protein
MKHPDRPLFYKWRRYRLEQLHTSMGYVYRVACSTMFGGWKGISPVYPTVAAADRERKAILNGLPDWELIS